LGEVVLSQSVIGLSGQTWKLLVAIIAILFGSFVPFYEASGVSWTAGTVIAIAGYAFGLVTIRCRNCNSLWFWEAAKDAGLYGPLFKGATCPECGHDFQHR
jgi:hypothetical protein